MKRFVFVLACLTFTLIGCTTNPVPKDYKGPLATIDDTYESQTNTMAFFFVVSKVDGKRVEDSLMKTREVNHGRGFYMDPWNIGRQVPVRALKLTLEAATHHAAPILALGGPNYRVSGEVDFTPKAGERYTVRGKLSKTYKAIWLEDAKGNIVTPKIEERR